MACTVDWDEDGSTVRVRVVGVIDGGTARRVSGAIATHVGIDGVEVVEVDTSDAEVAPTVATKIFEELGRRFSGAGQKLVITDAALAGDRAAALR